MSHHDTKGRATAAGVDASIGHAPRVPLSRLLLDAQELEAHVKHLMREARVSKGGAKRVIHHAKAEEALTGNAVPLSHIVEGAKRAFGSAKAHSAAPKKGGAMRYGLAYDPAYAGAGWSFGDFLKKAASAGKTAINLAAQHAGTAQNLAQAAGLNRVAAGLGKAGQYATMAKQYTGGLMLGGNAGGLMLGGGRRAAPRRAPRRKAAPRRAPMASSSARAHFF